LAPRHKIRLGSKFPHLHKKTALWPSQNEGLVELRQWQLPGVLPNSPEERRQLFRKNIWQKRRIEVLPYNECFHDNMYNFRFVVPVDIDEIIVPVPVL
jgi:hypothetical protein